MLTKTAGPEGRPEFHSRYADPNHAASSGHIFSLLSGGKYNQPPLGKGVHDPSQQHFGIGWVAHKIVMAKGESKARKQALLQREGDAGAVDGQQEQVLVSEQQEQDTADERHEQVLAPEQQEVAPKAKIAVPTAKQPQDEKELTEHEIHKMAGGPEAGKSQSSGVVMQGITRIIQRDILYLMIVNMPTAEEMAVAAKVLNRGG